MYFFVKNSRAGERASNKNKSRSVSNSTLAIERSRELLQQAEAAVSRSYAVVELSKRFVDSISREEKGSN